MFENKIKDKFVRRASDTKEIVNWANAATLLRIILTIPAVILFIRDQWMWGLIILAVAVLTDWLDGFLARKLNVVSEFGKAFDPFADKIMAVGMIILLIVKMDFPLWYFITLVVRDLSISLLSVQMYKKHKLVGGSNILGKLFICSLALSGILWLIEFYLQLSVYAYYVLIFSYLIMILSWIVYLIQYIRIIRSDKK